MKKVVLAVLVVLAVAVSVAALDIETYKAPAANSVLPSIASRAASPGTEIDQAGLAFLDVFPYFSLGVMIALEDILPITSWDQLVDLTYIPVSRVRSETTGEMEWSYGKERSVMTTTRALTFLTFFDLAGDFIWIAADEG